MRIKILSAVLMTVGIFGLCATAYADEYEDYGYNDIQAPYIGIQAGYGKTDYGSDISDSFENLPTVIRGATTDIEDGAQIAGRVYVGYQFNQYLSLETGYAIFSDDTYKANIPSTTVTGKEDTIHSNTQLSTQAWDLLGKGTLPLGDSGFSGQLKAGIAYMTAKNEVSGSIVGEPGKNFTTAASTVKPVVGLGFAYNFNPNLAMDISYLHYFGSSTTATNSFSVPKADLATIGISYLFA